MIKLIIFDMDGVLVEAKDVHYKALNKALEDIDQKYIIKYDEHILKYDGLKTEQKLELLHSEKQLPKIYFDEIWNNKQKYTNDLLENLIPSINITNTLQYLSSLYKIAVCSNSIRKTVLNILSKLDILKYIDIIVSNQDVKRGKPYPEIYWKAMTEFGFLPEETLILEDSPHGLLGASRTKSHMLRINNPRDITIMNIQNKIDTLDHKNKNHTPVWTDDNLNIVIPMAGAGSRFQQAGYTFPKPLIDINNRPMIELVVNNININANYIFIVQKEHRHKDNLDTLLNLITKKCQIIEVDHITEGAACTALLAKELINNDKPLFFANSDQYVEWDSNEFMYKMNETNCDGGIVTFKSTHPKWSFVKKNELGYVTEVAEKNPISDEATVGFYYWKHGSDFVKYAEQMIKLGKRINNEFYICPVYNEAIADNKKINTYNTKGMWGIGTPEDLDYFIKNYYHTK